MKKSILILSACLFLTQFVFAQKSKVQAAWRNLSDYEETAKEGKPNSDYLNKANEAIDLALANEDTKKQSKTHAYKLRISYSLFQYKLLDEIKKLESSVNDKNERYMLAYGSVDLLDFEKATQELNVIKEIDAKYLKTIQDGLEKGLSALEEEDLKFALAVQQIRMESGNIASGKYKAEKYEDAASYFYKTAVINSVLYETKDTANFYNACVAASKTKNTEKIIEYNSKMVEAIIASPYNYESIYVAQLSKVDSASAMETLRKGRVAFPDDAGLLAQETNIFLQKGRQEEALANLKLSIQKDPSNGLYYFICGQIYENMADPKDKLTGKEIEKPKNFEELFKNAESNYLKAIELSASNQEMLYNSSYNLGAMYNNYGGYLANYKIEKITDAAKRQKENEARAQEFYKKAIPYLEKALSIHSDDRSTMSALRKLYLLTGDDAKAKDMSAKLK
jgi:hypothetical protein